jgi:hypothetical protein
VESAQRTGPRYRVDDQVFYAPANAVGRAQLPAERYTVVAVLPPDHMGSFQYRLRPAGSGPQRVAPEPELRR